VLCSLVALRALPRRFLALALAPLAGLVSVVVQHKGFGYHFHPVTASTHMAFMVVVAMLWERFRDTPRHRHLGRWVAHRVDDAGEPAHAQRLDPRRR